MYVNQTLLDHLLEYTKLAHFVFMIYPSQLILSHPNECDVRLTQCTVSQFMRVPIRHNTKRPELSLLGFDFLGSCGLSSYPNLGRRHLGDVNFEIFQGLVLNRKTMTIPPGDIAIRS